MSIEPYRHTCGNNHVTIRVNNPEKHNSRVNHKYSCYNKNCNWKGNKIYDKKTGKWVSKK